MNIVQDAEIPVSVQMTRFSIFFHKCKKRKQNHFPRHTYTYFNHFCLNIKTMSIQIIILSCYQSPYCARHFFIVLFSISSFVLVGCCYYFYTFFYFFLTLGHPTLYDFKHFLSLRSYTNIAFE